MGLFLGSQLISPAELKSTYNTFTGADGTNAGSEGLVPAPAATDNNKYLKGDGTWATVSEGITNHGSALNAIAIGESTDTISGHAQATKARSIAIGGLAEASGMNSLAIGNQAKATAEGAIQLGSWGTANERGLFVGLSAYGNYKLLASNGKIPNDRIDGVSGSFTTADNKTVTVTNGIITAITPNE